MQRADLSVLRILVVGRTAGMAEDARRTQAASLQVGFMHSQGSFGSFLHPTVASGLIILASCSTARLSDDVSVACGLPHVPSSDVLIEVSPEAARTGGQLMVLPLVGVQLTGEGHAISVEQGDQRAQCSAAFGGVRVQATGSVQDLHVFLAAPGQPRIRVRTSADHDLATATFTGTPITLAWSPTP